MLTCTYGTNWLGVNTLVIMSAFLIISMVYLFSRNLPSNTRAKITGITKIEITQIFISVLILVILLAVTSAVCTATSSIAQSVSTPNPVVQQYQTSGVPFPALPEANVAIAAQTGDPFTYAESYVGNYSFNIGPRLAVQIYSYSYSFSILSAIWGQIGGVLSSIVNTLNPINITGVINVTFPLGVDLGIPYGILSNLLIDVFGPLVTLGIGVMLFQYIILVIADSTAFAILLPVALVMRSIAFSGGSLRYAANSLLAISIALYIIYPTMVIFDSYVLHWMFTPCIGGVVTTSCNPSATYLIETYNYDNLQGLSSPNLPPPSYTVGGTTFSPPGITNINSFTLLLQSTIGSAAQPIIDILEYNGSPTIVAMQYILLSVSEFLFIVIVMFAVNLMVVVGFSVGLTKALHNGIEGAATFWTNV